MEFVNNHTRVELHFIRWWYNLNERLSSQDHEEPPQTNTKQTCFHCRLILFNPESTSWSILQIPIIDRYNNWGEGGGGGGGVWSLDVSIRNTRDFQLNYKALGSILQTLMHLNHTRSQGRLTSSSGPGKPIRLKFWRQPLSYKNETSGLLRKVQAPEVNIPKQLAILWKLKHNFQSIVWFFSL